MTRKINKRKPKGVKTKINKKDYESNSVLKRRLQTKIERRTTGAKRVSIFLLLIKLNIKGIMIIPNIYYHLTIN